MGKIKDSEKGRAPRIGMADALFSRTQQRLLGLLFGSPERSFYTSELIRHVGRGSGTVQRELERLARSGLLRVTRQGNQKHYQANPEAPIYGELRGIARKLLGPAEPIREALQPLAEHIRLAAIYGSVAKGNDTAESDIDLLVVGDDELTLESLYRLLEPVETLLERRIEPTLYTAAEYRRRREAGHPFLQRVLDGERIVLMGEIDAA